jgi:hypothetical protein
LRFLGKELAGQDVVREMGILFVVAGSADRLTDAVGDYLDSPGPHRPQAMALARKLLADNGGLFAASSRGGTFAVYLQLNAAGRETLTDSLLSSDDAHGIYRVGNKRAGRGDFPFIKRRSSAAVPLES